MKKIGTLLVIFIFSYISIIVHVDVVLCGNEIIDLNQRSS